mgnify:CR=1 FL=1
MAGTEDHNPSEGSEYATQVEEMASIPALERTGATWRLDNGLEIAERRIPIGVVGAITAAVEGLPQGLRPGDVSLVSVSTTLATNAVVEGHGSSVGALLIGFDKAMAERTGIARGFPAMPVALIGGGTGIGAGIAAMPCVIAARSCLRGPYWSRSAFCWS